MSGDNEEVPFVVLQVYAGHWEITAYPTSRITMANCGHLAWLSPQGEGMAAVHYTVCTECFGASWRAPDDEMESVPGAVSALEDLWGPKVASKIRDEMRRRGITEG